MWLCCTGRLYGIAEFVVVFTNVTLVTRSLHISTRYLYVPEFERKQNSNGNGAFADNSVGWHLAKKSFHQHVRLLMEISLLLRLNFSHYELPITYIKEFW